MSRAHILLLNGPNLNLLGVREPEIYGSSTLEEAVALASRTAQELDVDLDHLQSNHEGELVDAVHRARGTTDGLIVNAGALTHYGWSLHDALAAYQPPAVELHVSNPASREQWRRVSVIAPVVDGTITGFGTSGYALAVTAVVGLMAGS